MLALVFGMVCTAAMFFGIVGGLVVWSTLDGSVPRACLTLAGLPAHPRR